MVGARHRPRARQGRLGRARPGARRDIAWSLSSFFVGEERVTTQFSGLVMAYETQSEEAFLTTQQVDEARHAQHFDRFYAQVLAMDGTFDERASSTRAAALSPDFVKLFDGYLVDAGRALVADPADLEAKVDFVTTYHMVIEGTLALTGQHFITRAFEERGILPGFTEGFRRVATDEHRHVAYGTWFLQQKAADPGLRRRIADRLRRAPADHGGRARAARRRPRRTGRCSATAPMRSTTSPSPRSPAGSRSSAWTSPRPRRDGGRRSAPAVAHPRRGAAPAPKSGEIALRGRGAG